MSLIDKLRESRTSFATSYDRFIRNVAKFKDGIHLFHEGQTDPSFYDHYVRSKVKNSVELFYYNCGNRKEVIRTNDSIKTRGFNSNHIALFFIDKDLADYINDTIPLEKNFFVTEYYSIENYLVSEESVKIVSNLCYSTKNFELKIDEVVRVFSRQLLEFCKCIKQLMLRAIYCKINKINVNFQRVKLGRHFSFDSDMNLVYKSTIVDDLTLECNMPIPTTHEEGLINSIDEILEPDHKKYIRGKFELWFFVKFMKDMFEKLKSEAVSAGCGIVGVYEITEGFLMSFLPARIKEPEELRIFLERNLPVGLQVR